MTHYASASKSYEGDYGGDDDDVEEDDGYDCLSDYDGDMEGGSAAVSGEGPSTSDDRHCENYSSRSSHHASKVSMSGGSGRHRTEFRRYRNPSERNMPDHSDDNRRDHHNHLERKRRASIKGSYCDLREAIPSLRGSKASRAVTLQRAAEYIESLKKSNHEHSVCVDELNRQNEILERQVQDLYRNYQRLENDEYAFTQAVAVSQAAGGSNIGQTGSFSAPAPPSSLPVVTSSSPGTSSTGNSTPTAVPLASSSSNGGSNALPSSFPVPVRVISGHQHQASTNSSTSSPDDPPPNGIPSSGLAQLSYAAMQIQQQQQSTNPPNAALTKPSLPASATSNNTTQMTRLITLEPATTGGVSSAPTSRTGVVPPRIRLSNSLSTTSGGRPIVVVSTTTTGTSATLSALDTAVLKARNAPRPQFDQQQQSQQQHVVVGSNMEVVNSSSNTGTSTGHQPRRVVIVSAQHHQEFPVPAQAVTSSKMSPP